MTYAIEVNNLNKVYDGFELKDVCFKLETGTIMGIVGENGAGKSTIIKSILDLINIDSGDIKIFGKDFKKNASEIKKDISVVFDESYFHDNLKLPDIDKIMKNIYPNWSKNKFLKYATEFKLPKDKKIKDFSRGMKMKLSIAVALSHDAKLLILDEATSMLDPMGRREINSLVKELNKTKDITIISITHDIEEAKNADKVIMLNNGKVVISGRPEDIFSDEMKLVKYELDIPFALKVAQGLEKLNIKTSKSLDMEVLIEELCQLHLKK